MKAGADAVYPGYGFLSENPHLAEACANAGITFIGPTSEVLELTGNKARAIAAAKEAGVPTLSSVPPNDDLDALMQAAKELSYPLFVKAVAGGGGRGMRKVDEQKDLKDAIDTCMREAEGAFGDPTVFIEEAVVDPRHIEVQILADGEGNVIHLFERDCSVQRRHQKVVEIAPAPNLDPELRERMCADAVQLRRADRLPQRRHRGVPARPRRQLRLHRDEPADPGRAHRDRGGHRGRPGAVPDADRLRRDPRGPRPEPGHGPAARCGAAVPDHHRGPVQRLPAGHRPDHDVPLPRRWRRPPRRRYDVHRRRDLRALRLDARQAHLSRPHLRGRRPQGAPGGHRVPDPWRRHEHPVPDRAARRARLPRGQASTPASSRTTPTCSRRGPTPTAAPSCSPGWPR